MRQTITLAMALLLIGLGGGWAEVAAEQTWTGVISDSQCKGDHGGEVEERECTLKCTKAGDQFVLVTDFGSKVWPIANQGFASLAQHAGHTVKVSGELKGGAIVLSRIAMP